VVAPFRCSQDLRPRGDSLLLIKSARCSRAPSNAACAARAARCPSMPLLVSRSIWGTLNSSVKPRPRLHQTTYPTAFEVVQRRPALDARRPHWKPNRRPSRPLRQSRGRKRKTRFLSSLSAFARQSSRRRPEAVTHTRTSHPHISPIGFVRMSPMVARSPISWRTKGEFLARRTSGHFCDAIDALPRSRKKPSPSAHG
jgi:hypothetical protein